MKKYLKIFLPAVLVLFLSGLVGAQTASVQREAPVENKQNISASDVARESRMSPGKIMKKRVLTGTNLPDEQQSKLRYKQFTDGEGDAKIRK